VLGAQRAKRDWQPAEGVCRDIKGRALGWFPIDGSLIDAIAIERKMFFEYEGEPYHCLDVEVSKPTARGGQTLVRPLPVNRKREAPHSQ
jgi:hypothetical protein